MLSKKNPIIIPILDILKVTGEAISEYELIGQLQQQLNALASEPASKQLALFQTHFLVMNALYQLQAQLSEDNVFLLISPLKIMLQTAVSQPALDQSRMAIVEVGVEESLRSYYLDWNNFELTSERDVDALLNSFWQYYVAGDKQLAAFQTLHLKPEAEWLMVQKAYRRLAADKHPDRGGSAEEFMAVREAYEVLILCFNQ